jgi:hypothetical protein
MQKFDKRTFFVYNWIYLIIKNIKMTKKEFLIKLLNNLDWYLDIAPSLRILIENGEINDDRIDAICNIFLSIIKSSKNKGKLEKSLDVIQMLKKEEHQDNIIDDELAEDLLKKINNF